MKRNNNKIKEARSRLCCMYEWNYDIKTVIAVTKLNQVSLG